jgi:hypothetical protein
VRWRRSLPGATSGDAGDRIRIDDAGGLQRLREDSRIVHLGRLGPVTPGFVALLTSDGLSAVDLLTGRTLWQRPDVPARAALFGDGEHLFVVERNADGKAAGTRAFRARDGFAVSVPDFAAAYDHRLRVAGGELLVEEKLPAGGLVLRLYDVAAGKDVWSQKFAAGTVVMRSHDPDLAGVVEPGGRVTVVSLSQRKVVLGGSVEPDHMKNLKEAHLLADAEGVYVVLNTQDPQGEDDVTKSNLLPDSGLRGITVNGQVYAFSLQPIKTAWYGLNPGTTHIRWYNEIRHQQLVLEQGQDLPVLLFTARGSLIYIDVYDKTTGKIFFKTPSKFQPPIGTGDNGPIYAMHYDRRDGRIELIANTYKLTIARAEGK